MLHLNPKARETPCLSLKAGVLSYGVKGRGRLLEHGTIEEGGQGEIY
jgi:hypothetical protein